MTKDIERVARAINNYEKQTLHQNVFDKAQVAITAMQQEPVYAVWDMAKDYEQEPDESGLLHEVVVLLNEVDCRIEHGAESGGHLDYVRKQLKAIIKAWNGRGK